MKIFLHSYLIIVGLFFSTASFSANLMEVYSQAKNNDIGILSSRAKYKMNDYDVNIARGALLPQASVQFTHNYIDSELTNESTKFQQDASLNSLSIQASQALFDLNSWYNFQAARAVNDISGVQLAFSEQQLILRVAEAYFNTLKEKNIIEVVQSQKNAIENSYKQARARYKAGIISFTDVQQSKARFDLAKANLVGQKIAYEIKREELEELTGRYYANLSGLKKKIPLRMPKPESMQYWIDSGLKSYPPLILAEGSMKANRLKRNAVRSNHLPTVKLIASYKDEEQMPSNTFKDSVTKTVGIQVSMPLLAGGSLYYQSKKAALSYANTSLDIKKSRREIKRIISSVYQQISSSILIIRAQQQSIKSLESALKAVESGYKSGTRTILELLDAQGNLADAKKEYEKARYDYVLNQLRLKLFAGKLNEQELAKVNRLLVKG